MAPVSHKPQNPVFWMQPPESFRMRTPVFVQDIKSGVIPTVKTETVLKPLYPGPGSTEKLNRQLPIMEHRQFGASFSAGRLGMKTKQRDRIFEEGHAKIQQVLIKPGRVSVVSEIEREGPWFHRSSAGKDGRPRAEQTGKTPAHLGGNQQLHLTDLAGKRLELSGKGKNRPGTKAADLVFGQSLQRGRRENEISVRAPQQFGHRHKIIVQVGVSDGGDG